MLSEPPDRFPTEYWHILEDGRIQCDLCPRACKLREGQQGLCYVRACEDNQVVLKTYGRSSGYCIDPVEKKPLNHFLPGTPVLSFGTAGCNLACKFCQNWDMSKSREMDTLSDKAMPETIAYAAKSLNCQSIAFTYNDPIIFMEYAVDVAKACHEVGVKSIAVTAGYICPKPRTVFFKHMDAANIDLKAFTEKFYKHLTGSSLSDTLDTLLYLKHETNVWIEITTLLIPGENDSPKEIEEMCTWIYSNLGPNVPIHFSAFHPDWKMKDTPATPPETLFMARNIAIEHGLHYAYTGNIHHVQGDTTFCVSCGRAVIVRDWYNLLEYHLDPQGHCDYCQAPCPGVFEGPPGQWGAKRQMVFLKNLGL